MGKTFNEYMEKVGESYATDLLGREEEPSEEQEGKELEEDIVEEFKNELRETNEFVQAMKYIDRAMKKRQITISNADEHLFAIIDLIIDSVPKLGRLNKEQLLERMRRDMPERKKAAREGQEE